MVASLNSSIYPYHFFGLKNVRLLAMLETVPQLEDLCSFIFMFSCAYNTN